MFKVGDVVRNVAANVTGVVVEVDGDTVYLEQPNGAEVDFAASVLVLESDYQAKHDRSVRDDPELRANNAVYDAVLENLYPAVVALGQQRHAQAERVSGIAPTSWDALSALQKLNLISEATDVPVKAWVDANRPGAATAIGPLQLSVLERLSRKS
jgi:hypothetical protein